MANATQRENKAPLVLVLTCSAARQASGCRFTKSQNDPAENVNRVTYPDGARSPLSLPLDLSLSTESITTATDYAPQDVKTNTMQG